MSARDDPVKQILAEHSRLIAARINSFRFRDYGLEQTDLAQDIFIKIWEYYEKNDNNIGHLRSYICKVVNSVVIDAIKESRKEGEALARMGWDMLADRKYPGSKDHDHNGQLKRLVLSSVNELRPSRRKVIGLYLSGLTLDEIAALMGCKRSKTNNLFYRGLADLRKKLAAKDITYED